MKYKLLFSITFLLLVGCKTQTFTSNQISGKYIYESKEDEVFNYIHTLDLSEDYNFYLKKGKQFCNGSWEFINKNKIILRCNIENNIAEKLSIGYLDKREYEVIFLTPSIISIENIIMHKEP